jgi:hypothetical protein
VGRKFGRVGLDGIFEFDDGGVEIALRIGSERPLIMPLRFDIGIGRPRGLSRPASSNNENATQRLNADMGAAVMLSRPR